MAKYTQVRLDTFQSIQINAGVILNTFDPATGSYTKANIIGATTGGNSFSTNPTFSDYFADVDNVPNNTKQGKKIEYYDPALSTTFVTIDNNLGKMLITAADLDTNNSTHIIPRNSLKDDDFKDIWLVGDYSDKNNNTNGGFVAIHIKNALNTGGFQFQSTKNGKGQFSADFHGHYDIEDIDDVPFEVYIKSGSDGTIAITTQPSDVTKTAGSTASFTVAATTTTGTLTYQWQSKGTTDAGYTDISGETSATLSLSSSEVIVDNSGTQYRCKVGNGTDSVMTNAAILTVNAGV